MTFYESIGFFWVVLTSVCASVAAVYCVFVGAKQLYQTYKQGQQTNELDRIIRQ